MMTTTTIWNIRWRGRGGNKTMGIVECDLVSGCRHHSGGATMAKYKSKSQPPSFLSSFCPPASFIFLFRLFCDLRHRRRCFVVLVAGALYPRISLAAFSSWPPSRFLSLYAALVSRASVFRFNSPYASLFSDHFGFHPRTSRSDKIMGDELNKK